MKLELAPKIVNIALDYDLYSLDVDAESIEIRPYTGRGSRKETTGIVGLSAVNIMKIVLENAHEFTDENGDPIFQDVGRLQTDSMGLSTIIY